MSETLKDLEIKKEKKAERFYTYAKSFYRATLALLLLVAAIYIFIKMGYSFCWWGTALSDFYNWGCGV